MFYVPNTKLVVRKVLYTYEIIRIILNIVNKPELVK